MKLMCSRGHAFDTEITGLVVKGRCPMVMSYNVMQGSTYCRRTLQEVIINQNTVELTKHDYYNLWKLITRLADLDSSYLAHRIDKAHNPSLGVTISKIQRLKDE